MKEFVMQETEEMTTFGSVWKRYEPVAELVRCRNCKYWRKLLLNRDGDGACHADNPIRVSNKNWFCADGERKNDGHQGESEE